MNERGRSIRPRPKKGGVVVGPARGAVTNRGPFVPTVKLDPSAVRDLRGRRQSTMENIGNALIGGVGRVRRRWGEMWGTDVTERLEGQAALRRFSASPRRRVGPRISLGGRR